VFRAPVAEYLCRKWNARNTSEKQIAEFEFIFCMMDKTEAGTTPNARIVPTQLVRLDFTSENGRPAVSGFGDAQPPLGSGVR
jgi:hypothetical protein